MKKYSQKKKNYNILNFKIMNDFDHINLFISINLLNRLVLFETLISTLSFETEFNVMHLINT